MSGTIQKERIIKNLRISILKIKFKIITDPEEIRTIIAQAMKCRKNNDISNFKEICTSPIELLRLYPD